LIVIPFITGKVIIHTVWFNDRQILSKKVLDFFSEIADTIIKGKGKTTKERNRTMAKIQVDFEKKIDKNTWNWIVKTNQALSTFKEKHYDTYKNLKDKNTLLCVHGAFSDFASLKPNEREIGRIYNFHHQLLHQIKTNDENTSEFDRHMHFTMYMVSVYMTTFHMTPSKKQKATVKVTKDMIHLFIQKIDDLVADEMKTRFTENQIKSELNK
jgi:hypothetical protein